MRSLAASDAMTRQEHALSSTARSRALRQASDESTVRRYLRALVGFPLRAADEATEAEAQGMAVLPRWARRAGVDRRTLRTLGVSRRTLDRVGIVQKPTEEGLRRYWNP